MSSTTLFSDTTRCALQNGFTAARYTNLACCQTLSIDPINGHIIELLNSALQSNAAAGIMGQKGLPMGDEEWSKKMREHRNKGKDVARLPKRDDAVAV